MIRKINGCFRIQLLLGDWGTWSTRYNIPKTVQYSDSSFQWTLVSLDFAVEIYGNNFYQRSNRFSAC